MFFLFSLLFSSFKPVLGIYVWWLTILPSYWNKELSRTVVTSTSESVCQVLEREHNSYMSENGVLVMPFISGLNNILNRMLEERGETAVG